MNVSRRLNSSHETPPESLKSHPPLGVRRVRQTTAETSQPEHFAAIVNRHFVRLKEMTMTATAEPSPTGFFTELNPSPPGHLIHAAAGTCCDRGAALAMHALPGAAEHYRAACHELARADASGYNLAERGAWIDSARTHLMAADMALKIWPARLTELQAVADAARDLIAAGEMATGAELEALRASLQKLDADA